MSDQRLRYDADRLGQPFDELVARLTPIGRRLEPGEMAPMAALLAGGASGGITGQAFNVCGGVAMF